MDSGDRKSFTDKSLRDDENIKALIVTLANTSASLEHGEKIYATLGRTVRRLRIMLWFAVIGLVLTLSLLLSFAVVLANQSHLNDKIKGNTDRIEAQQQEIHKGECDLNTLLLSTDDPGKFAATQDKKLYIQQYHVLYETRKSLKCQPVINEPVRSP